MPKKHSSKDAKIVLACSVCAQRNYTTARSGSPEKRLELNKFCTTCNTHTLHKETK